MSELVSAWRSPRRSIATSSTTRSGRFDTVGAGIHAERAADATGDAVIECEATEPTS